VTTPDQSFLAPPLAVTDWRKVLLVSAATETGLLDALPGRADDLAARLGLDEHATLVALEALALFDVVRGDGDGTFSLGRSAPDADAAATLYHHARSMRQWAASLEEQLRGNPAPPSGPQRRPDRWLDSMAVGARRSAPLAVDACLTRFPATATVLDLGGGHGEYAREFAGRGLSVTMQDRQGMIDIARQRGALEAAGVQLFAGDFFEVMAPGPFDIVFCSGVTNTFSGARNIELYEQVRSCLAPEGRLAIHTSMRDRQPATAMFGVQMLVVGNGGDAHPERLYRQWLEAAGYQPVDILDVDGGPRSLLFAQAMATS